MPHVEVLRPFANGHHDDIVHPGDIIEVTEDRRRDLGELVREVKAAPPPSNKMAPTPANKATAEEPVMPFRRGPGRPPGSKASERR